MRKFNHEKVFGITLNLVYISSMVYVFGILVFNIITQN